MSETVYKKPEELFVGDIFRWSDYGKVYHFKVNEVSDHTSHIHVNGELLWANGDGLYFGEKVGFVERFSFRKGRYNLQILKTTKHGCCDRCNSQLEWVSLVLKCMNCGNVVV